MGVTEDYRLSMYQDYGLLGTKEHIRLVRNKNNGQICVKKIIDYTQSDVVQFRKTSNSSYFPKLFDVIEDGEKCIIIEEYVNGITLEEYMVGEPLAEEEAVRIAHQICKALLELHQATPMIVYRDLKTENIMLTSDGKVKLIDFNISRSYQEGKKRDTILLGTAEYAAPEQFGYFQTDNRTDIYAFGILFNYMLTTKFPIEHIAEGKFSALIRKCIELEPSKRYQRMEEVLVTLGVDRRTQEVERFATHDSWLIPGFRSGKIWKMVLAALGYVFILYFGLTIEFTQQNGEAYPENLQWINRIIVTISQIATVFFTSNYRGISKQFTIYKHRFLIVRVFSYITTWFLFFLVAIMFSGIFESIIGL